MINTKEHDLILAVVKLLPSCAPPEMVVLGQCIVCCGCRQFSMYHDCSSRREWQYFLWFLTQSTFPITWLWMSAHHSGSLHCSRQFCTALTLNWPIIYLTIIKFQKLTEHAFIISFLVIFKISSMSASALRPAFSCPMAIIPTFTAYIPRCLYFPCSDASRITLISHFHISKHELWICVYAVCADISDPLFCIAFYPPCYIN